MAEKQIAQGKFIQTGDDLTCPNCGSQRARRYNRMHCDVCGRDFDVAKSEIGKVGVGA